MRKRTRDGHRAKQWLFGWVLDPDMLRFPTDLGANLNADQRLPQ
jgi:hypothetical protein